jgi:hypothetical protein
LEDVLRRVRRIRLRRVSVQRLRRIFGTCLASARARRVRPRIPRVLFGESANRMATARVSVAKKNKRGAVVFFFGAFVFVVRISRAKTVPRVDRGRTATPASSPEDSVSDPSATSSS